MSTEVSVFAPMAAEGAVDTGQAPAKTQTVRGRERRAHRAGEGAREPTHRDVSLLPESRAHNFPSPEIVASPSKMLRGPGGQKIEGEMCPEWE